MSIVVDWLWLNEKRRCPNSKLTQSSNLGFVAVYSVEVVHFLYTKYIMIAQTSFLIWALSIAGLSQARPAADQATFESASKAPRPLVIWYVPPFEVANDEAWTRRYSARRWYRGVYRGYQSNSPGDICSFGNDPRGRKCGR
jgi:hypothetical protein